MASVLVRCILEDKDTAGNANLQALLDRLLLSLMKSPGLLVALIDYRITGANIELVFSVLPEKAVELITRLCPTRKVEAFQFKQETGNTVTGLRLTPRS